MDLIENTASPNAPEEQAATPRRRRRRRRPANPSVGEVVEHAEASVSSISPDSVEETASPGALGEQAAAPRRRRRRRGRKRSEATASGEGAQPPESTADIPSADEGSVSSISPDSVEETASPNALGEQAAAPRRRRRRRGRKSSEATASGEGAQPPESSADIPSADEGSVSSISPDSAEETASPSALGEQAAAPRRRRRRRGRKSSEATASGEGAQPPESSAYIPSADEASGATVEPPAPAEGVEASPRQPRRRRRKTPTAEETTKPSTDGRESRYEALAEQAELPSPRERRAAELSPTKPGHQKATVPLPIPQKRRSHAYWTSTE